MRTPDCGSPGSGNIGNAAVRIFTASMKDRLSVGSNVVFMASSAVMLRFLYRSSIAAATFEKAFSLST